MQNAVSDGSQVRVNVARRNINNLKYADDNTVMAESKEEIKSFMMKVKEESEKAVLKLNIQKYKIMAFGPISSVQSLRHVRLFATPWTIARQISLSITNSQSLLKLMSIESVMPSNHLILCHSLLPPSIFPSIRVFSNESVLCIRWPKCWSFSFSISPSNEYSGLISFRMDWLDLLAVQGTLNSLLQHHSSKASIRRRSAFFIVQLSHPYMTTGKTIALTRLDRPTTSWQTNVEKVETVTDFIFLGSKITANADCSYEIKRWFLLGRKADKLSILNSRNITLPTKVCLVKAIVFPVVIHGCESWTIKTAQCWRINAFRLWCRRRFLSLLGFKETKPMNLNRNQSWIFTAKTDAEA